MAGSKYALIVLFLAIAICGCESDNPNTDTPEIHLSYLRAAPVPHQDAIRIEWDLETADNLSGYKLYRGNAQDDVQIIATLSENDVYYEDDEVSIGVRYYYRLSGFNDAGNESDISEAVFYALLGKSIPVEPENQSVIETITPTFKWLGVSGASSYVIHVYSRSDGTTEWDRIWSSDKVYPYQELRKIYNYDNLALKPLEDRGSYRWRIDSIGGDSTGSQSRWLHFSVSITQ
jgi:hypothetical protein